MLVRCKECKFSTVITPEVRFALSQENKEILNKLLNSRYNLDEFHYCTREGYLVSNIGMTECENWYRD